MSKGTNKCYFVYCIQLSQIPYCSSYQAKGTVTVSVDANFGLCRKKAAGASVRGPLSGQGMFLDQGRVDEFVSTYSCKKTGGVQVTKGCCMLPFIR